MITTRLVRTWEVLPCEGYATAWAELTERRLTARGRAVGLVPEPYWVTYGLDTGDDFVTPRLRVTADLGGRTLSLDLRNDAGRWSVDGTHRPDLDGALDCDLGLCRPARPTRCARPARRPRRTPRRACPFFVRRLPQRHRVRRAGNGPRLPGTGHCAHPLTSARTAPGPLGRPC
ncbi:putative glycolipid-binding domain-containing protein [Streptomyces sp. NBC_00029]|uniref:putative glycolipid-binding domain-containing protein n=1 Tax=Streptomyces sp. NBC_00029 TaxID=2903613 RepID=UPI003251D88A